MRLTRAEARSHCGENAMRPAMTRRFDDTTPARAGSMSLRTAGLQMRLLWIGMLMAVLSTLAVTAWAQPMPGMGMGGMGHHHGMGGGDGMMMGGSPERMGRMIDHMLDGL